VKDITHIERPNLPWRNERRTECGLDAERHPTWTRAEAVAKFKELGQQRFSLFVCMTCKGTAERHATWEDDPASCMARYARPVLGNADDAHRLICAELRAIALLVEAHRDEFDAVLADLGTATDLTAVRTARRAAGRFGR
jgi:hypothetical protein